MKYTKGQRLKIQTTFEGEVTEVYDDSVVVRNDDGKSWYVSGDDIEDGVYDIEVTRPRVRVGQVWKEPGSRYLWFVTRTYDGYIGPTFVNTFGTAHSPDEFFEAVPEAALMHDPAVEALDTDD